MSAPRFEIVDTGIGFLARYVSGDGNKHSWTSRTYQHRRSALVAIFALIGEVPQPTNGYPPEWDFYYVQAPKRIVEVRMVTEQVPYRPASRRPLPETGAS